jgi:hypothetical protein
MFPAEGELMSVIMFIPPFYLITIVINIHDPVMRRYVTHSATSELCMQTCLLGYAM